jgi:hypothetical protein
MIWKMEEGFLDMFAVPYFTLLYWIACLQQKLLLIQTANREVG